MTRVQSLADNYSDTSFAGQNHAASSQTSASGLFARMLPLALTWPYLCPLECVDLRANTPTACRSFVYAVILLRSEPPGALGEALANGSYNNTVHNDSDTQPLRHWKSLAADELLSADVRPCANMNYNKARTRLCFGPGVDQSKPSLLTRGDKTLTKFHHGKEWSTLIIIRARGWPSFETRVLAGAVGAALVFLLPDVDPRDSYNIRAAGSGV